MSSSKESISTGFGSKLENEGKRLLNKDGSFNIEKIGVPFLTRFSLFHSLINISIGYFILVLLAFFLVVNSLFAFIYVSVGVEHLGIAPGPFMSNFLNAFFFSSQTLTTVGYGAIAPTGILTNIIASFESFVGLLSFAMATGLLYGRFSKPRARLLYSKNMLVSPYQEGKALMFRLANAKDSSMINVKASMMFSVIEVENGEQKRKFYSLDLEIDRISLLASSWTVVHSINENSPFWHMKKEDVINNNIEVFIQVEGYDETYSQHVYARTSYKKDEIIFNARFLKILGRDERTGKATASLDKISDYEVIV